jgi:transcriptional regulator of heat shock response
MSQLTPRNIDILRIIVEEYLDTGEVLWSKALLKKYALWVSPATVRNDMANLEKLELIFQPYNSAGRLPTAKWLRAFVNYLMQQYPDHFLGTKHTHKNESLSELADYIHTLVYELAKNTGEIAFCFVKDSSIHEYSGIADFISKNQRRLWEWICNIIRMIEDKKNFRNFISGFPIREGVNVFIGEENILPYLRDYTIILKPILVDGKVGYIGIIWSLKMNYSFNISAVRGII